MPIHYEVMNDGHFIDAVTQGEVSGEEFVEYEVAHAIDNRIKPPVSELLHIGHGACSQITMDDIASVVKRRETIDRLPTPHRCAIVPSLMDDHTWNLAKFYEGMVTLHYPESVIVFADTATAKVWLGVDPNPKRS